MAKIEDRAVLVTAFGLNKTLKDAIQDGNLSGGGGGGGLLRIFNTEIQVPAVGASILGLVHFRVPVSAVISQVAVTLFNKNGISTGTLTVDIKKNTTPDEVGMTSIFSVAPSFDFAVDVDYAEKSGTLASSAISSGDWLRLDLTSIPANWGGTVHVSVYA